MKTISQTVFFVGVVLALMSGVFMATTLNTPVAEAWGSGDYGAGCCDNQEDFSEGGNDFSGGNQEDFSEGDDKVFPLIQGCTDEAADNYDATAKVDDLSCEYTVSGCTDVLATNYDSAATEDNGSCTYPEPEVVTSCALFASAETVAFDASVTLNWETEGFTVVKLNGAVVSDANGSQSFDNVTVDTTYTLTATNEHGDHCTATVTVQCLPQVVLGCTDPTATNYNNAAAQDDGSCEMPVAPITPKEVSGCTDSTASNFDAHATTDDGSCVVVPAPRSSGGGGSSSPRCELEASETSIVAGEAITLTWETRSTQNITLTNDRDAVLLTSKGRLSSDKRDLLDYSIEVKPTQDTVYTLLAERGSRDRECTVAITVEDNELIVLETRDQAPLVAGISLQTVPYTGFEAGPVMMILFYILLAAWALYLTYVLVIPRMSTVVTAPVMVDNSQSAMPTASIDTTTPASVAASMMAPVSAAPVNLPVAPVAPEFTVAPTMAATTIASESVEVAALEAVAHNHQALVSSDAIQTFVAQVSVAQQLDKMVSLVNNAKAHYPLEDGWVVINNDRMMALLAA